MTTNDNENSQKSPHNFCCELCNYATSRKDQYDRHLSTSKHIKTTNNNGKGGKVNKIYECLNCSKIFNDRAGLWRHKKKCNDVENISIDIHEIQKSNEIEELKAFMKYLMQENSEMKSMMLEQSTMMMEVIKNGTYNNNTISTNSHNKAFNLQFFLNETCKDAMNITDFVESIKLQVSDLENVAEVGYIEGISNIIVKNLKKLDVTQRPVHCTDKKRETMYVKDEDTWEKDEENKKMHRVVKKVTDKNARLIFKYKELHPDCMTYHSRFNDKYNKIIVESMGGSGDNMFEKEEKIIQRVSKEVTVDKAAL
jgi:hypothetical protein